MAITASENQLALSASQEYDLLTETEKYMSGEITLDQFKDFQHRYAQSLKAVALRLAEIEQSNQVPQPVEKHSQE